MGTDRRDKKGQQSELNERISMFNLVLNIIHYWHVLRCDDVGSITGRKTLQMKSVIVIETPASCNECPGLLQMEEDNLPTCIYANRIKYYAEKPQWCPLRALPEKWEEKPYNSASRRDWQRGYNRCIDDILGVKDEREEANKWWSEHSSRFD